MSVPPEDRPGPPEASREPGAVDVPGYASEEEADERSTPRKDLIAAVALAGLSLFVMLLSVWMPNPGTVSTAPGLLPFLTGLSLLAMAVGLGVSAARRGAVQGLLGGFGGGLRTAFTNEENRRMILLLGVIFLYVILVSVLEFDLSIPLGAGGVEYRLGGFELVTIAVIASILRASWRAAVLKCLLVASAASVALSALFRYGFHLLLPGSG